MNFNHNKVAEPPTKKTPKLEVIYDKDYSLKMKVFLFGSALFMLSSLIVLPLSILATMPLPAVEQASNDAIQPQGPQDEVVVIAKN